MEFCHGLAPFLIASEELQWRPPSAYVLDVSQDAKSIIEAHHPSATDWGPSSSITKAMVDDLVQNHAGDMFVLVCSAVWSGPTRRLEPMQTFCRVLQWFSEATPRSIIAVTACEAAFEEGVAVCQEQFHSSAQAFPADACVGHLAKLCWWTSPPAANRMPLLASAPSGQTALLPGWEAEGFLRQHCLLFDHPLRFVRSPATGFCRLLVPLEMEKLLGLPGHYTAPLFSSYQDRPLEHCAVARSALLYPMLPIPLAKALLSRVGLFMFAQASCRIPSRLPVQVDGLVNKHFPEYGAAYWALRRQCPYIQDVSNRGLRTDIPMGPDVIEQNAHSSASLALLLQSRTQTAASGQRALLPLGLDPVLHFECGQVMESPLSMEPPVPDDLVFALRMCLRLGRGARAWRRRQLSILKAAVESARGLADMLDLGRSNTSVRVASHVHLDRLDLARFSLCWPDVDLLELAQRGAHIVGNIPASHIYRPASVEPTVPLQEFEQSHAAFVQSLLASKPPPPDQVQVIWEKSEAERQSGTLRGYWTASEMDSRHGAGRWRPMPRFAVWQQSHAKWRLIDDAKASSANRTIQATERIHTTSASATFAAVRRLRSLHGHPLAGDFEVRVSTHDLEKAYRQIPVIPEHLRFSIVAIYHPERRQWVFAECDGLAFGLSAAVLGFNRVPSFIVALARRWLAIPLFSFFDDFKVLDVACSSGSATRSFLQLLGWLGYRRDPGKDQMPSTDAIFLGAREVYSHLGASDSIWHLPRPGREEQIRQQILQIQCQGRLSASSAMSLRGKLLHLSETYQGRSGRVPTPHLDERAASDHTLAMSPGIRMELELFLEMLETCPYRQVPMDPSVLPQISLFTDASFHVDAQGVPRARICFIVACARRHIRRGAVIDVPPEVLSRFQPSETLIAQAEALAPMLALYFEPDLLQQCLPTVFIDNMGVLCNFVLGSSSSLDLGCIVHATVLRLMRRGVRAWWEHVPSKSNIADGGSRMGVCCPIAAKAGIPLVSKVFPRTWPQNHVELSMKEWERFWTSH